MSVLRHCSPSPAAAPPLEDEDLLSEILLCLPPEPSSLPRASAVCKRWRRLVSDPRFIRCFRLHHRRNPPLLGFFKNYGGESFQPTLEAPNRVAPGRFTLQRDRGDDLELLGCRHGLALMLDMKRRQALVWDPVTSDQHRIDLPPRFDAKYPQTNGAVLRAAGDVHFQVTLVMIPSDKELHRRVLGCVYSSETGLWGNLISSPPLHPTNFLSHMPAVLVGDSLFWTLLGEFPKIFEFDLERQSLAMIPLPMDLFEEEYELTVLRAEGGGLGFLLVSQEDLSAQLWKRKTDCDNVASWELGRTIELDKLFSLNSKRERCGVLIQGFAECNNVLFLWTLIGIFMVELESLQFKKVCEAHESDSCKPFESVYAADTGIGGGHGGAEV